MMVDIPDEEAIQLLHEYAGLVKNIAQSACYSSSAVDFADLCQVGNIAVLKAVKAYDPTHGASIKSYVAKAVRREVYNEAARFLGVFTVDRRVTSLASKVHRLSSKGKDDQEISKQLEIDTDYVRQLRLTYEGRNYANLDVAICDDEYIPQENTIHDIMASVVETEDEAYVVKHRILGNGSAKEVARFLGIKTRVLYEMESSLKQRIRRAIEDEL